MKTWFVTNVQMTSNGAYDRGLADKLNELEAEGHVIFSVSGLSGQVVIVSYTM
jgi:hypothetical protein